MTDSDFRGERESGVEAAWEFCVILDPPKFKQRQPARSFLLNFNPSLFSIECIRSYQETWNSVFYPV